MHETQLKQGLREMGVSLKDAQIKLLLDYLQEFHKWNQAYNLSAIREPEAMVTRHLLDSLALTPFIQEYIQQQNQHSVRLIDVGTGGGLPGVPLAIACPELDVTLLDSNGKKTRFLFQTAIKLDLKNIKVENIRVEKYSPADKFAIVTSRAFATIKDMVSASAHLLVDGGEFWAMKGVYPESELAECQGAVLKQAHKLVILNSEAERYLIILNRQQ